MKKFVRFLRFALIGWIAGILCTLTIGLLWPAIFPGLIRSESEVESRFILSTAMIITLVITSLPSLIGGLVGGILPREGGSREQLLAAALGGIILSIPFGCFNYWLLSGA